MITDIMSMYGIAPSADELHEAFDTSCTPTPRLAEVAMAILAYSRELSIGRRELVESLLYEINKGE